MSKPETIQTLPTIAVCTKCGRGFVAVNPNSDMLDTWPAQNSPKWETAACGGQIEMLTEPVANES